MKRYYSFGPDDLNVNNFILLEESSGPGSKTRLKEIYSEDACGTCGKVDEFAALHRHGIQTKLRVPSGIDVFSTDNGTFCILSEKAKQFLEAEGVGGIDFLPVPDSKFYVAEPTVAVSPIEPGHPDFKWGRKCSNCGRYSSVYRLPTNRDFQTIDVPPGVMFDVGLVREKPVTASTMFHIDEITAKRIKKGKLRNLFLSKLDDKPFVPKS